LSAVIVFSGLFALAVAPALPHSRVPEECLHMKPRAICHAEAWSTPTDYMALALAAGLVLLALGAVIAFSPRMRPSDRLPSYGFPAMEFFLVDAFQCGPFTGNPAAVVPLAEWLPSDQMQAIGGEFNLSETAFLVGSDGKYDLRWFTPAVEVDLCGHATLATAHVLFNILKTESGAIEFSTRSGILRVERDGDLVRMALPTTKLTRIETPVGMAAALGFEPLAVVEAGEAIIVELADEQQVKGLDVDPKALDAFGDAMICVTAAGAAYDYVTRVFAPAFGIDEDPATGSAQCVLAPYWSEKLGKTEMRAFQVSARGAELGASWAPGDRHVLVSGTCRAFARGTLDH
jgi:PhzF family phenazine biosynthesis protein